MTTEEIIHLLDHIQNDLDNTKNKLDTIRAALVDTINSPYEQARRLTAEWVLRGPQDKLGFPGIQIVDVPVSTVAPSEMMGFMKPLTPSPAPYPAPTDNIDNWLDFDNPPPREGDEPEACDDPNCWCKGE